MFKAVFITEMVILHKYVYLLLLLLILRYPAKDFLKIKRSNLVLVDAIEVTQSTSELINVVYRGFKRRMHGKLKRIPSFQ